MKPATRAPFYACIYHGLCAVARKHGYALAIHGTVTSDLDLVAIPWTEEAADATVLRDALMEHIYALDYEGVTRRELADHPDLAQQIIDRENSKPDKEATDAEGFAIKPHGRRAVNLYMDSGSKVDLSIMPKTK